MKKLSLILSRKSLLTIYKSFVRPNLDYADIIYDKPLNESLKRKIEMVQYNAALIITGAFKGTSRDKIYQELGLESLADRRWTRKLFFSQNNLRNINSYPKFCQAKRNSVFEVNDLNSVKLLTRLKLDFSHLNEHKFRNTFHDTINPMCSCGKEPETTLYYLLCCDLSLNYRLELLNYICA